MQDIIRYPAGAPTPIKGFDGVGHYEDANVLRVRDASSSVVDLPLGRVRVLEMAQP